MILDCFLQVRLKPNILWMCRRSALEASTRLRSPALTFKKHRNARASAPDELPGSSVGALLQGRQLLFLSVWFASVFGFGVSFSFWVSFHLFRFWLFECLFVPRQPGSFLIIKIWKLNFHSIFSNHLIKISSTTTKKIRSSCNK